MRRQWLCGLLGVVLALPAGAAPPPQLIILEAAANTQTGLLTVVGVNFGAVAPTVQLGGQTLVVQSSTDSELVATLPVLPPGNYLLSVARGPATVDQDTFSLTLGSTGGGGGDIDSITAGAGLLGGGSSGDVTLEVDSNFLDSSYLRTDGSNNGLFARLDIDNFFQGNQSIAGSTVMYGGFSAPAPSFVEFTLPDAGAFVATNNATTGCNRAITGNVWSECATAIAGGALGPTGGTGVAGGSRGDGGVGVSGTNEHLTGHGAGVVGQVYSPNATAGEFVNYGDGAILIGANSNGVVFSVAGDGTVNAFDFVSSSSRRYKANVEDIDGALATIEGLRPVAFDWKATGKRDIGLIAEEVAEVAPQVVAFDEEGAQGIDYQSVTALLIEAVQEQQAQIRELQERLAGPR